MESKKIMVDLSIKPKPPIKKKEEIREPVQKIRQKRVITTTEKWINQDPEIQFQHITKIHSKQENLNESVSNLIMQQISQKISGYRSQDIEKKILDEENLADLSGVLLKLNEANYICYYCREPVQLLYENVREPKQWTLERMDNKRGHVLDNVEIACLSCNLRRRTMKPERYVMTKNIRTIVKTQPTDL
jgi:5-methylcytosine-specific restriction endonuclease McrA